MRPVDIEADVKEMERRKRVEAIMNSQVIFSMVMVMVIQMVMVMVMSSKLKAGWKNLVNILLSVNIDSTHSVSHTLHVTIA